MTVQITIIGLGRTGSSFGLALGEHKQQIQRVGHDKDFTIAANAQKNNVIDQFNHNLHDAVINADLVLLTTPFDQIYSTLEQIGSDLKEGVVVLDTSNAKVTVSEWTKTLLPKGRYYIGLTPMISPQYLLEEQPTAHADLYKNSLIAICGLPNTSADAYKLATDFVTLVGAQPLFTDLFEIDGLMSAAEITPRLISSALVRALILQPGWQEARKFAGKNFWDIGAPSGRISSAKEFVQTWQANEQNLERLLDDVIRMLQIWRDDLQAGETERLIQELDQAQKDYQLWQAERQKAGWNQFETPGGWDKIPNSSERIGGLFGMNLFNKKQKEK